MSIRRLRYLFSSFPFHGFLSSIGILGSFVVCSFLFTTHSSIPYYYLLFFLLFTAFVFFSPLFISGCSSLGFLGSSFRGFFHHRRVLWICLFCFCYSLWRFLFFNLFYFSFRLLQSTQHWRERFAYTICLRYLLGARDSLQRLFICLDSILRLLCLSYPAVALIFISFVSFLFLRSRLRHNIPTQLFFFKLRPSKRLGYHPTHRVWSCGICNQHALRKPTSISLPPSLVTCKLGTKKLIVFHERFLFMYDNFFSGVLWFQALWTFGFALTLLLSSFHLSDQYITIPFFHSIIIICRSLIALPLPQKGPRLTMTDVVCTLDISRPNPVSLYIISFFPSYALLLYSVFSPLRHRTLPFLHFFASALVLLSIPHAECMEILRTLPAGASGRR